MENTTHNYSEISIKAISEETQFLISALLNPIKVIPAPHNNLPRYWKGLAELCQIQGELIPKLHNDGDPTKEVLNLWYKREQENATVQRLLQFFEDLDRFDIIFDIRTRLEHDINLFINNDNNNNGRPTVELLEPLGPPPPAPRQEDFRTDYRQPPFNNTLFAPPNNNRRTTGEPLEPVEPLRPLPSAPKEEYFTINYVEPPFNQGANFATPFNNNNDIPPLDQEILTIDDAERLEMGLRLEKYDAYVLVDTHDNNFTTKLFEMEIQYGMKFCFKEKILGGAIETDTIIKLIAERCNRLIVVLSPAFFASEENKYYLKLAQNFAVKQGMRKVIPCIYKALNYDRLPHCLSASVLLHHSQHDFWKRLRFSLIDPERIRIPLPNPYGTVTPSTSYAAISSSPPPNSDSPSNPGTSSPSSTSSCTSSTGNPEQVSDNTNVGETNDNSKKVKVKKKKRLSLLAKIIRKKD